MFNVRVERSGPADQVRTFLRRSRELLEGMDRETFNRRPPAGGWSAAQCFDHLNVTARLYLPIFAEAIEDARARGLTGAPDTGLTWFGRFVAWSQEPPVRFRMSTYSELEPDTDLDPAAVLEELEALHEELIVRINESGSLDRKRIRIASALSPRIRLSLGDWFQFLNAHARRHFWQAERVLEQVRG
jgi:hypothetical protein